MERSWHSFCPRHTKLETLQITGKSRGFQLWTILEASCITDYRLVHRQNGWPFTLQDRERGGVQLEPSIVRQAYSREIHKWASKFGGYYDEQSGMLRGCLALIPAEEWQTFVR